MTTHQCQAKPELVVATQSGNGATNLRGFQVIQAAKMPQDLNESQECLPVPVRAVMEQLLALTNFMLKIFHASPVLLELLAIPPAMSRMLFQLIFQLLDEAHLRQHFASQVVLSGGHVMTPCHMSHRQSQTATVLIAMTELTRTAEIRRRHAINLQTTQFRMQTHHPLAGQQDPDVVLR